jgi:hypothetical protein
MRSCNSHVEHLARAAREVAHLERAEREARVARIVEFLRGTLVSHAKAEEVLYTEWAEAGRVRPRSGTYGAYGANFVSVKRSATLPAIATAATSGCRSGHGPSAIAQYRPLLEPT